MMRKSVVVGSILFFFFLMKISSVFPQSKSYYDEGKYRNFPIITFKENFWGNPIYLTEEKKIKAFQVREYMEIMPGNANDFLQTHTKAKTGTILNFTSSLVGLGALAYIGNNFGNLNNEVIRNFLIVSTLSTITSGIGFQMNRTGIRKLNTLIENHNYLIRQDEIIGQYLRSDFRNTFFGERIDLYDGPSLMSKEQINDLKIAYPDFQHKFKKAEKAQNLSLALDVVNFASQILFTTYIISPRFQSSTPSNFLIPLTITSFSLSISSPIIRRSARNKTRLALQNFNFEN